MVQDTTQQGTSLEAAILKGATLEGASLEAASLEAAILRGADAVEFSTAERCDIAEWSNSASDPALSIAHARVAPGVTTRWHRVVGTVERYVILHGSGRMEVAGLPPTQVGPGDVVIIPADCPQRITNTGGDDLLFLAVCTPRFRPEAYEDVDPTPLDAE
jgi:mannose-6-phosphate isomerase-like protein (cupin superfamily)